MRRSQEARGWVRYREAKPYLPAETRGYVEKIEGLVMLKLGMIIVVMLLIGAGVAYIDRSATARSEAQRIADGAQASAEALEREKASLTILQREKAVSDARVDEAEGVAAGLVRRLDTAEQARKATETEMGLILFDAAKPDEPVDWTGAFCPVGCIIPLPVSRP